MLVRRMIWDEVDDHFDPTGVGFDDQPVEIRERPEDRRYVAIVGDVVAEISHWRGVEGRDPHRIDAQPPKVVEATSNTLQVAYAVSVAVLEGARIHLVEDATLPPVRAGHATPPAKLPPASAPLYRDRRAGGIIVRTMGRATPLVRRGRGAGARAAMPVGFGASQKCAILPKYATGKPRRFAPGKGRKRNRQVRSIRDK